MLSGNNQGRNRVSEETAERIRRIRGELKFRPNHGALALKGKHTGVIAALASNWFYVPLRPRFLAYLNEYADRRKLKLLTWQTDDRPEPIEEFVGESASRGVDGLIYLAFDNDGEWPAAAALLGQLPNVVSVFGDPGFRAVRPYSATWRMACGRPLSTCTGKAGKRSCRLSTAWKSA